MYKKQLKYLGLAVAALLAGAPFAYAQLNTVQPPVQYVVSPQTPGPNTQVTIEVQGVGTFLGNSTITWSVNGKVVLKGVGVRDLTFATGNLGTQTKVHVAINSSQEGTLTQDWVFNPSSINMVWEANTSVPPLYRGKALYSGGSDLKVVAFPSVAINGKSISSNNLSFQWTVNDTPVPQMSGLGQNSLSFTGDQLQSAENVEVSVYYGAAQVGYGQVVIPATTPQLLLYDYDPLRGLLLDSALPSAVSMTAKELTVQAVPYYFANQSLQNGAATYAWTLNGDDTTGPNAQKGLLTLRQTGTGAGAAVIGVSVQNTDTSMLVQAAQAALQVIFGQSTSGTSLFGL
jgi:hypothetical protein